MNKLYKEAADTLDLFRHMVFNMASEGTKSVVDVSEDAFATITGYREIIERNQKYI